MCDIPRSKATPLVSYSFLVVAAKQRMGKFALPTEDTEDGCDGDVNPEVSSEYWA